MPKGAIQVNTLDPRKKGGTMLGPALSLTDILGQMAGMTGPTATQKTQQVTQAARAPELESQVQTYLDRLNQLSQGFEQAFGAKQQTYEDVIRSLTQASQTRAGTQARGVSTAALASGLTPVEATQLGQGSIEDVLQQYYPQLAGMRAQQADVGVGLQQALQGVDQDYASMIANVIAPYQKGVAGTTATTTGESQDILGRLQAMAGVAGTREQIQQQREASESQAQMQQAQLDQQWREAVLGARTQKEALQNAYRIAQMQQAGATERTQMGEAGAGQRISQQLMGQAGVTGMRERGATERAREKAEAAMERIQLQAQTQREIAGARAGAKETPRERLMKILLPQILRQGVTMEQAERAGFGLPTEARMPKTLIPIEHEQVNPLFLLRALLGLGGGGGGGAGGEEGTSFAEQYLTEAQGKKTPSTKQAPSPTAPKTQVAPENMIFMPRIGGARNIVLE